MVKNRAPIPPFAVLVARAFSFHVVRRYNPGATCLLFFAIYDTLLVQQEGDPLIVRFVQVYTYELTMGCFLSPAELVHLDYCYL